MSQEVGKWLIVVGSVVLLLGVILYKFGTLPGLNRLGNLPGDIRIEKENTKIYIPITTMILLSIVFTLLVRIMRYFQNGGS